MDISMKNCVERMSSVEDNHYAAVYRGRIIAGEDVCIHLAS